MYKIIWYIIVQCGISEMTINFVKNRWSSKNKNNNFKIFLEYSLPTWVNFFIKINTNLKNSRGI